MKHKTIRSVFVGFTLLTSLSVGAQEPGMELQLSNDVVYWYRICNALPGMEGYAMTDLNGAVPGEDQEDVLRVAVYLLPTETEDYRSQWKLTAGEEGRAILTNRATGSQISNHSSENGNHNVTWLTFSSDAPGFSVTSLGDGAFRLVGVEDDGVNRCLALAESGSEAQAYPASGESASVVGWKFFPVEIEDAVGSLKGSGTTIRVQRRRISVSGTPEWQLFNASGEEMPRTVPLATGVYLVKLPQRTIKIAIQ